MCRKHASIILLCLLGGLLSVSAHAVRGTDWRPETDAAWAARASHSSVIFDGKMWVMGGSNGSTTLRDVWSSPDGHTWTQAATPTWVTRQSHASVVYGGKMWVMGGISGTTRRNDVWSWDGVAGSWTQATSGAAWAARNAFSAEVFDGKMWIMGGYNGTSHMSDVWYSTDGSSWIRATSNAGWSRSSFASTVYNGKMWIMGGTGTTQGSSTVGSQNDVWSTTDGTNWVLETPAAPWTARAGLFCVTTNAARMWIGAGYDGAYYHDVWSSTDGVTWTLATAAAAWPERYLSRAVYLNDKIWVLGGRSTSVKKDVWYSGAWPTAPSGEGATAIGTDTITWTWSDNSSTETGFKVYDDPGAGPPATLQTTTAANEVSWQHGGLLTNAMYSFQVAATNVYGDSDGTANFTAWTLAATPVAPVVGNPTTSTLDVTVGAGDGNPSSTLYAIQISPAVGGNTWVQADGSVGATAVYQTAAAWGTVTVTGLAASTNYTFTVIAQNGAGVDTAAGPGVLVDRTPPVIGTCAADASIPVDTSCEMLVPDLLVQVSATDDVSAPGDLVITQNPVAGATISGLGAHPIVITVEDEAGNQSTCTATITLTAFDHAASRPAAVPWTTNGTVSALLSTPGALYVAGTFTEAGPVAGVPGTPVACTNLAAVNPVTGAVLDWAPGASGPVTSLAVSADGATLFAGGDGFVDKVDIATELSVPLITGLSGTVDALAVSGTTLLLGGGFASYIDAYDLTADAFTGWTAPAVSGPVFALAVVGTTLYAGTASGVETVALEAAGFGTVGVLSVSDGPVYGLAAVCETLYAGGDFATIGGQPRSRLAALDMAGAARAWAPAVNGPVGALAVSNAALWAAGGFTAVGGVAADGLVRFGVPSVTLLSPNGGEMWASGSTQQITWASSGLGGNVRIRLWDNLTTSVTIVDTPIKNGSYEWTLPKVSGGKFHIQLISREDQSFTDWSDGTFSIGSATPFVTVLSPNGGELLVPGTEHTITWSSNLLSGNVRIRLWDNLRVLTVLAEVPMADGGYTWTVPALSGSKFRLQLISHENSIYADWSDADFSIGSALPNLTVGSPNGGETWAPGSTQTITWAYSALGGNVKIRLWDNLTTYTPVAEVPMADCSYTWTVPAVVGSKFRIQLIASRNSAYADFSDGNFAIGTAPPSVTVVSPNGGEILAPGSTATVRWTSTSLTDNVTIRLWDELTRLTVLAEVPLSDTSYDFTVPATPGTRFRIQLIATRNSLYADWSDGNFTIGDPPPPPVLALTAPNGGETWTAGTMQAITWTTAGIPGNMKIRLWDNLATYTQEAEVPISDGVYLWTIPNTPGSKFRIQIISSDDSNYADWSDANFTIVP